MSGAVKRFLFRLWCCFVLVLVVPAVAWVALGFLLIGGPRMAKQWLREQGIGRRGEA